jgi:hypothetical protein
MSPLGLQDLDNIRSHGEKNNNIASPPKKKTEHCKTPYLQYLTNLLPDANLSQLTDEIAEWGQTDPHFQCHFVNIYRCDCKMGAERPHFVAIYR